jgi:hypothetical protein
MDIKPLNSEQQDLVASSLGIAQYLAGKLTGTFNRDDQRWQDAFDVAQLALVEAAATFRKVEGATFRSYAFRVIERRIIRHRQVEKTRFGRETAALNVDSEGGQHDLEVAEYRAGAALSPEETLLFGGRVRQAEERLSRLGAEDRERVEAMLDGGPSSANRHTVPRLARVAGVRVGSKDLPSMKRPPMSGAERQRRLRARMSTERRAVEQARKNEAKTAARRRASLEA